MQWQCAKQLTHQRLSHRDILYTEHTKTRSQIMHILHHLWSIQPQAKLSTATNDWWIIPKLWKYGKQLLEKILEGWRRVKTKQVKKAQIWCSLWHTRRLMVHWKLGTNRLTRASWLITSHKKRTQIGYALRLAAISLRTWETRPRAWLT